MSLSQTSCANLITYIVASSVSCFSYGFGVAVYSTIRWRTADTLQNIFELVRMPWMMPAIKKAQFGPSVADDYAPTLVNLLVTGLLSISQYSHSSWSFYLISSPGRPKRLFQTYWFMKWSMLTIPISRLPPTAFRDLPSSRAEISSNTLSPIGTPKSNNCCSRSGCG